MPAEIKEKIEEGQEQQVKDGQQPDAGGDGAQKEINAPTVEELMVKIAEMTAENRKLKGSVDKATKEAADAKKKLRESQTAEQQAEEAKRIEKEQHDEYVRSLEQYKAKNEAYNRYIGIGFDPELATKAADAELEDDKNAIAAYYKMHNENVLKVAKQEWINSIPSPNAGGGNPEDEDPFIKALTRPSR